MPTLTKILIKRNYLRRISGIKPEKFEKMIKALKPAWGSGSGAEARCRSDVRCWGIARTFTAIVDVLSDVHNAFVFSADF